jgi:hypothetical protein
MFAQSKRQPFLIFLACLILLGILGWMDYLTGYELGFFVFYSIPIGIAAWNLGRWPAVFMSLLASVAWAMADSFDGEKYSTRFACYWNNGVHFASFIINAVAIARIKVELDRRQHLAAELAAVRNTLAAVAGQLPACPVCGQIHHRESPTKNELRINQPVAELDAALCPACRSLNTKP